MLYSFAPGERGPGTRRQGSGTTFRPTTGTTAYLSNAGTLEHAQQIAGHASPKTTKLYDRTRRGRTAAVLHPPSSDTEYAR